MEICTFVQDKDYSFTFGARWSWLDLIDISGRVQ